MLVFHNGKSPKIAPTAYVAPTASIVGDVSIGPNSRILFGAVITAEGAEVKIGANCIVSENSVLKGVASPRRKFPLKVGNNVFISPHSTLQGCTIESDCYISDAVSIYPGAAIASGGSVGTASLVHMDTIVKKGLFVPPHSAAIGNPPRIFPTANKKLVEAIHEQNLMANFHGVDVPVKESAERFRKVAQYRSKIMSSYLKDKILP